MSHKYERNILTILFLRVAGAPACGKQWYWEKAPLKLDQAVSLTRRTHEITRTFAITNASSASLIKAVVGGPYRRLRRCGGRPCRCASSMRVYADRHVAPVRRGAACVGRSPSCPWWGWRGAAQGARLCSNSAEANSCRDGKSSSPLMRLNVLKCGLEIAARRYWSGSSRNSCIIDLTQGLEPGLESKDESKGRR